MLVVDHDALQAVDFLDLVDEVGSQCLDALDRKDVVRRRVAVEDVVALLDVVAFLKMERLALRDQVFDRLEPSFMRLDEDAALVLVVAAETDRAIDFGDDRVILRTARFEQFGHARQTARDVLGLGAFQRDTRDDVAGLDLLCPVRPRESRRPRAGSGRRHPSTASATSPFSFLMTIAGFRSVPRGSNASR